MKFLYAIIILVCGYLLGSLSFSIILSRLLGKDIRRQGSGNAGATNMTRVFGWAAGVATLAFDFLKALAQRTFDPLHRFRQISAPGDPAVFLRIQRIQTDVQAIDARLPQRRCQLWQQRSVCGQAKLPDPFDL